MRIGGTIALLLTCVLGAPGEVFPQAIAGAVSDASGAALTGVAVKAESAALIEKTRTVVTDRNGPGLVYRSQDFSDAYNGSSLWKGALSYVTAGILNGWGVRPSDWSLDVSVQQQILSRGSATVGYSRRWFHGFAVADNLALQLSDLMPFSIVAPRDPRLPDGGGYVVSGLYDVAPEKSGQLNNLIVDSAQYGRWFQYFNGVDATINLRADRFTVLGGTSTGQTVAAAVVPSLGRSLSGNAPNVTVNLIAPGTRYGDRINQVDIRVAKAVRHGPSRTMIALDVYNALNSSAGLTYNSAFVPGGVWPPAKTVLTPRFFGITAELEF